MADLTNPEYEQLPAGIKARMSVRQFLWLGEERNHVIERETMPDPEVTE